MASSTAAAASSTEGNDDDDEEASMIEEWWLKRDKADGHCSMQRFEIGCDLVNAADALRSRAIEPIEEAIDYRSNGSSGVVEVV